MPCDCRDGYPCDLHLCTDCDGVGERLVGMPVRVYGGLATRDVMVICEACMGTGVDPHADDEED